jgi:hypothetical protein
MNVPPPPGTATRGLPSPPHLARQAPFPGIAPPPLAQNAHSPGFCPGKRPSSGGSYPPNPAGGFP